jgi:hypothetical protein
MMEECRLRGLVFDRNTKECRESRRGAGRSALEQAYARGSLFFGKSKFGVNRPAADQRAGVIYSVPASTLTQPEYGIIGPINSTITGPSSFQVSSSNITPAMAAELGIIMPNTPAANPAATPSNFGTYSKKTMM